jgi:hypothetical protein
MNVGFVGLGTTINVLAILLGSGLSALNFERKHAISLLLLLDL